MNKGTLPLFGEEKYQPPEKFPRGEKARTVAFTRTLKDGIQATVCNICDSAQGLPHKITGETVVLTETTSRGNKLWLCQECKKFADSIHKNRKKRYAQEGLNEE